MKTRANAKNNGNQLTTMTHHLFFFLAQVESDGTLSVEIVSSDTLSPTISPAPSNSRSPTPLPSEAYPCPILELQGPYTGSNANKMGDYAVGGKVRSGLQS